MHGHQRIGLAAWRRSFGTGIMTALLLLAAAPESFAAEADKGGVAARSIAYGVYDPQAAFRDDAAVSIEHIYMPLLDADPASLTRADTYAHDRKRLLLITLEPRSWSPGGQQTSLALRDWLLAGRLDGAIKTVCAEIGQLRSAVTIRWAHEMDVSDSRFPWSSWAPQDYIAGFRHFVDHCRPLTPKAKFMWSPRGESGLEAFYPGSGYVDEIGLTILGLQAYDRDSAGHDIGFDERFRPAYDRVSGFGKPVVIAELGFAGDDLYRHAWLTALTKASTKFPALTAAIYFDSVEPVAWPSPYGHPDWRISPPLFDTLRTETPQ